MLYEFGCCTPAFQAAEILYPIRIRRIPGEATRKAYGGLDERRDTLLKYRPRCLVRQISAIMALGLLLLMSAPIWAAEAPIIDAAQPHPECESEACLRAHAQKILEVRFPEYLSWRYCGQLRQLFINDGQRRLAGHQRRFNDSHSPQPLQHALNFVQQQQAWLEECHMYHLETGNQPLFGTPHLSTRILMSLDDLSQALLTTSTHKNLFSEQYLDAVTELDHQFQRLFGSLEDYQVWTHVKTEPHED